MPFELHSKGVFLHKPYPGLYVGYNYCQSHMFWWTWMLTAKPVYKLLNVSDDLKWTTNTHVTPFSLTFKI